MTTTKVTSTSATLTPASAKALAEEFGWKVFIAATDLGFQLRYRNPQNGAQFLAHNFEEGVYVFEIDGAETTKVSDARAFMAAHTETFKIEEAVQIASYVRRPSAARWTTVTGFERTRNGGIQVIGAKINMFFREGEEVYVRIPEDSANEN